MKRLNVRSKMGEKSQMEVIGEMQSFKCPATFAVRVAWRRASVGGRIVAALPSIDESLSSLCSACRAPRTEIRRTSQATPKLASKSCLQNQLRLADLPLRAGD